MPELVQYLLKVSISLGVSYLFYSCVLRSLTFYIWNRWYLLLYICLSFVLPLIDLGMLIGSQSYTTGAETHIPGIEQVTTTVIPIQTTVEHTDSNMDIWRQLLMLFVAGSVIMAIRMLLQILSLSRVRSQALATKYKEATIYNVSRTIRPFSFAKGIYVNKQQHTDKELEDIILHEYAHVKQFHSIDIILAELLCIICWYNPFAWLMRESIKQNLEFIADDKVIQLGLNRKSYQYHLLSVAGITQYNIANPFNFSSLKKRIQMMNKIKNTRIHLFKFLFVLPVTAVVLFAFRQHTPPDPSKINYAIVFYDLDTKKTIPGVSVRGIHDKKHYTANDEGYVLMPYSVAGKKLHVSVLFTKEGYYSHDRRFQYPLRKDVSIIEVIGLRKSDNTASSTNRFLATMSSSSNTGKELENDARNFYLRVVDRSPVPPRKEASQLLPIIDTVVEAPQTSKPGESQISPTESSKTVEEVESTNPGDNRLLYIINPDGVDMDDIERAKVKFQSKGINLNASLDHSSSELRIALKSEKSGASATFDLAELKRLKYVILLRADPATSEVSVVSDKQ